MNRKDNEGYWEQEMKFRDYEAQNFTYRKMKEHEERVFRNELDKKEKENAQGNNSAVQE